MCETNNSILVAERARSSNRIIVVISLKVIIALLVFKTVGSALISSELLNVASGMLVLVLFVASVAQRTMNYTRVAMLLLLAIASINMVLSLIWPPSGVALRFTVISSAQVLFPLMFLFVLSSISFRTLSSLYKYTRTLVVWLCAGAILEVLILPEMVRDAIANYFLAAKHDVVSLSAYSDQIAGISWGRAGSILFEPLSLAIMAVTILVVEIAMYRSRHFIQKITLFLGVLFAGVKSAWITVVTAVGLKIFGIVAVPVAIGGVVLLILKAPGLVYGLFNGEQISGLESVSNHLIGLFLGTYNAFSAPFSGHGLGTAGYLVWLETKNLGVQGPFLDDGVAGIGLANGNESAFGVLTYQLGFPFIAVLVFLLAHVFVKFIRHGDRLSAGAIAGLFIFFLLSESALAFSIQSVVFTAFMYRYKQLVFHSGRAFTN